jgi:DNA-directed RNA polymerase subunit K/omega
VTLYDVKKMMQNKKGKYLMVSALARRVRALQSGSKPLVPHRGSVMDVAIEEFKQGLINVEVKSDENNEMTGGVVKTEE